MNYSVIFLKMCIESLNIDESAFSSTVSNYMSDVILSVLLLQNGPFCIVTEFLLCVQSRQAK